MSGLPRYTLVHKPPRRTPAARAAAGREPVFPRLSLAEFLGALAEFTFRRSINVVHLHHTWRPNHAQYQGHASIVAMWRHHTATNGWSDIAQHVSIGPEGAIWPGRDWNVAPASASGHNGNAAFGPFMIEMIGDFDEGRDPWEGEQRNVSLEVIAAVQRRFELAPQALRFHNQMSAKTCPGSSIHYTEVVEEVAARHVPRAGGRAPAGPPAATAPRVGVAASPRTEARAEAADAEPAERGSGPDVAVEPDRARAPRRGATGSRTSEVPPGAVKVGLWDLDAYVGALPKVVEALNAAQDRYRFFEALAAVPAGIISQPPRVRAWFREKTGKRAADVERNIIAEGFFKRARAVRQDLRLDFLAGLTTSRIADEDETDIYYNLFATFQRRLLLVSTGDLRGYARKARRPFEAAVLGVAVAELLAARHRRLVFHEESRGCLFDYNEDRAGIVAVLRKPMIESDCLARIPAADRGAALALVSALDAYKGATR